MRKSARTLFNCCSSGHRRLLMVVQAPHYAASWYFRRGVRRGWLLLRPRSLISTFHCYCERDFCIQSSTRTSIALVWALCCFRTTRPQLECLENSRLGSRRSDASTCSMIEWIWECKSSQIGLKFRQERLSTHYLRTFDILAVFIMVQSAHPGIGMCQIAQ